MEQVNMMQNAMGGSAQMAAMQRPQAGNLNQQMYAQVLNDFKNGMASFNGHWQATLDPRIRATGVMQLVTALRMLEQDVRKCMGVARKFELSSLQNSTNKQQYEQMIQAKLEEIKLKRTQSNPQMMATGMPGGVPQQPLMQPPQMVNNMNAANQAAGFPGQLTRPMQPSMIQPPPQQQQQPPPPTTMDPSFLVNNAQQPAAQFATAMNNGQNNAGNNMPLDLLEEAHQIAIRLMNNLTPDKKEMIRQQLFQSMNEATRNSYVARGEDLVKRWAINKAKQEVMKRHAMVTQGLQIPQQNLQRNNQLLPNNEQFNSSQKPQANSNNFSLAQLYGQQASAMKLQESGEQVVPVSENMIFNGNNVGSNPNAPLNLLGNGVGQMNAGNGIPNNLPDAQRRMLLQQQQQQQQLIQQQNNLARAQALNAQQQAGNQGHALSGQPGGLNGQVNFNPGQLNNPAMSMLNRPLQNNGEQQNMLAQGQIGGFSPFQGNNANALAQQHQPQPQNMFNPNGNNGLPPRPMNNPQQYMVAMLNTLPPETRNKILSLPPAERAATLQRLSQRLGQQQNQNRPVMPPNQMLDNMTAQNNLLSVPQSAPAPPAPPGNAQLTPEQQMQRQRQQQMLKGQAMLSRQLPRNIASLLQIAIPPNIQRWGQLRQHIQTHAATLPPDMPARVMTAMEKHFQANPGELQQAMREILAVHQRQQQQQAAGNPNTMAQRPGAPIGLASVGGGAAADNMQMFVSQANNMGQPAPAVNMMQPSPGGPNRMPPGMNPPQISDQEIARFRQMRRIGPNITDDQIRHAVMQNKIAAMQSKGPNNVTGAVPFQTPAASQMNRPGATAQQLPGGQRQPNVGAPQPRKAAQANDDVVEIPPPAVTAAASINHRKPAPGVNSQKGPSQQQMQRAMPTPEQMAKMPKERREQIQQQMAIMQRNGAQPVRPNASQSDFLKAQEMQAHKATLTRLYQELGTLPAKGGPVKVEPQQVHELRSLFRKMWKPLQVLEQTFASAYKNVPGFNDERAKQLIRAKWILNQNMLDEEGNIKGHLSASNNVLKQCGQQIMHYYAELQRSTHKGPDQQAAGDRGAQQRSLSATQQGMQGIAPPPMAVSRSQATNKASSNKAPAAPVDDKRFNWNVPSPSPHGVPKYDTQKPDLTPDQLKIPAVKKRKTGTATASQPATPAQTTPGATPKLPSAANAKVMPVKAVQEAAAAAAAATTAAMEKQKYRCSQMDCEASISGFDSQSQLDAHVESAHAPVADPFAFLMEATAGVIAAGNTTKAAKAKILPTSAAMSKTASKRSSDGALVQPGKALTTTNAAPKAAAATVAQKTMYDVAMEKIGFADFSETAAIVEAAQVTSDDDFLAGLGAGLLAGLEDIDPFFGDSAAMEIEDWGLELDTVNTLTPPELTPDATESNSSRNSDVSASDQLRINMTWDPFDIGDTHLPEFLRAQHEPQPAISSRTSGKAAHDDEAPGEPNSAPVEKALQHQEDTMKENPIDDWDWSKDELVWDDFMVTDLGINNAQAIRTSAA